MYKNRSIKKYSLILIKHFLTATKIYLHLEVLSLETQAPTILPSFLVSFGVRPLRIATTLNTIITPATSQCHFYMQNKNKMMSLELQILRKHATYLLFFSRIGMSMGTNSQIRQRVDSPLLPPKCPSFLPPPSPPIDFGLKEVVI